MIMVHPSFIFPPEIFDILPRTEFITYDDALDAVQKAFRMGENTLGDSSIMPPLTSSQQAD